MTSPRARKSMCTCIRLALHIASDRRFVSTGRPGNPGAFFYAYSPMSHSLSTKRKTACQTNGQINDQLKNNRHCPRGFADPKPASSPCKSMSASSPGADLGQPLGGLLVLTAN